MIRVRESPLRKLDKKYDLEVPFLADADEVAAAVFDQLANLGIIPVAKADDYRQAGGPQASERAEELIREHLGEAAVQDECNTHAAAWERMYTSLLTFEGRSGHCRVPEGLVAEVPVSTAGRNGRLDIRLRTSCKDQVHGVLAKLGVTVTCTDIFGTAGSAWLDALPLPQPYAGKVTSLRHLAGELTTEITILGEVIADLLAGDRGYQVIQQLPGIGPVLAAVITAEIGDVTRFKNAGQLCSWAGLTPRHRESDTKVARGHVTKQGSRLLRWALIEAIQRIPKDCVIGVAKDAIIARRGKEAKNIAKVAAARRLLTLVFYGMRDGQIRCLSRPPAGPVTTQTAPAA